MLEGKRFFPLTGTPIPKMLFIRTLLADCEPEPFTVATLMLKSFVTRCREVVAPCASTRAELLVAIWRDSLPINSGQNLSLSDVIIITGAGCRPGIPAEARAEFQKGARRWLTWHQNRFGQR